MNLDKNKVWKLVKQETNPATNYEIGVINTILGIKKRADEWRFQKGIHCYRCSRELTILDFFLSGIQDHSIEEIKDLVVKDLKDPGQCEHDDDPNLINYVEVADNTSPITCCNCGNTMNLMHKLYMHPGYKGRVIRMPSNIYRKFAEKIQ